MSRRHRAEKRDILPDAKFGDRVLTKVMNSLMVHAPIAITVIVTIIQKVFMTVAPTVLMILMVTRYVMRMKFQVVWMKLPATMILML